MPRQGKMSQSLLREPFLLCIQFMGWRIIEIQNADKLRLFLDNLVIYRDNDKIIIPINDIDTLLIDNIHINLSIQLINKLSDFNVNVIICNDKHLPNTNLLPVFGNYNSLKVLNAQLEWNHYYKSNLWVKIIKQKISNQLLILEKFDMLTNDIKEEMFRHIRDIRPYDVTNREGHAAKIYWHTLFGISFNRRDENEIINKYLNYGYAILRSYLSKSIVKKGLDPRISIFHKSFHNHFALSSDLMEVFRIIIDFEVIKIVQRGIIDEPWYMIKQQLIECFNNKIKINNQINYINNAIDIFVDCIINQTDFPTLEFNIDELDK